MGKRFLVFIVILIGLFFLGHKPVQAQEFNYDKAYSDYIFTYNQYREAYNQFVTAKQAYLSYQTLNSKNEAKEKTLNTVQLRDDTVIAYLTALRLRLSEVTKVSNYDLNLIYIKLDTEIDWYKEHRIKLTSAGSLEDLVDISQEAEKKYSGSTQGLIYKTLFALISFKENSLYNQLDEQVNSIKAKLADIRQNGGKNTLIAERWQLDAEQRLARSLEKQKAAQTIFPTSVYSGDFKNFSRAQAILEEANQYLKESNFYCLEIIKEVKNAD